MNKKILVCLFISAACSFSLKFTTAVHSTKYDFKKSTKFLSPIFNVSVTDVNIYDGLKLDSGIEFSYSKHKGKNKGKDYQYNLSKFSLELDYKNYFKDYYKHSYGINFKTEIKPFEYDNKKYNFNYLFNYKFEKTYDWYLNTKVNLSHAEKFDFSKANQYGIDLDLLISGKYKVNNNFTILPQSDTYFIINTSKSKSGIYTSLSSKKFEKGQTGLLNNTILAFEYKKDNLKISPEAFISYRLNASNSKTNQMAVGIKNKIEYTTYLDEAETKSFVFKPEVLAFVNTGFDTKNGKSDFESKLDINLKSEIDKDYKTKHSPAIHLVMNFDNIKDYSSKKKSGNYDKKMKLNLTLSDKIEYIYNKEIKFVPSFKTKLTIDNLMVSTKNKYTSDSDLKLLLEYNNLDNVVIKPSIETGLTLKDLTSKKISYYFKPAIETDFDLMENLKLSLDTSVKFAFDNNKFKNAPLTLKLDLKYSY